MSHHLTPLSLSDILVQSKSGTGKTLVFSVVAMEKFNPEITMPQTLILSPTREIAIQTADTLKTLGKHIRNFKAEVFIGGLSVAENRTALQGCSVVVGTPGRILHLIEINVLNTKHINLLILDEVDLLTELNFNLDKIIATLDRKRLQVITVSATLDKATETQVAKFMKSPIGITAAKEQPVLLGIGQFVCRLRQETGPEMMRKFEKLKEILSKVTFKQCFVFTNSQSLAESYKKLLARESWPSEVITGTYEQKHRVDVLRKLKAFNIRVLLSTDLMARGIDAENVNLVINMEVPRNGSVYLHRIGRAGRFGTKGVAVTLVATDEQQKQFEGIQEQFGMQELIMAMPQEIKSERVWEMVDEQMKRGEEVKSAKKVVSFNLKEDKAEDPLSLLLDDPPRVDVKKGKVDLLREMELFDETQVGEREETNSPDFSLLLDANEIVGTKVDKVKAKSNNIFDGFEDFSETEVAVEQEDKDKVAESISMINNLDEEDEQLEKDTLDLQEILQDNENRKFKNKEKKGEKKKKAVIGQKCTNNWATMFKMQYEMIANFVATNQNIRQHL